MKTCSKCKTEKEMSLFSFNKSSIDGRQHVCKECANTAAIAYYEKNKMRVAERNRLNAEKKSEYNKAYKASKKAEIDAYNENYRRQNREVLLLKRKEYYAKNSESCNRTTKNWRENNKSVCRIYNNNRRLRTIENGGKLSNGLAEKLIRLQKGKCACCKSKLLSYHMDHVMPIAKGGANSDSNIQLLCPTCNHKKHAKHPVDFMQQNGYLL